MQRTLTRLPRPLSRRPIAYLPSIRHSSTSPFTTGPAPPRLPKEEQEIFDRLQKQSTGAFSQPRSTSPPQINQSPDSTPDIRLRINQSPDSDSGSDNGDRRGAEGVEIRLENGKEIKQGEEVHPNMRRGAPPEFEGDVNPKTGEVGGPKNEPLRWGVGGDWSYNGRVTDF
ncbi:hypothetical protein BDV96DRAFT_359853 [Lophiotrema nucula]|uniref:Succinate dehydrogenase assembly factor 4, mitochondrial n=1 Tax=Lophiotrema nucula TaxID=690887 RepID=A0A6A5YH44_9PLEO|nr:hypothetical protein BDV96DRAFT_359853 [Lophiotrema nucula]